MSYQDYADEPEENFFKRNRIAIGVGLSLLVIVVAVAVLVKMYGKVPPPHKPEEIVIHLQPPPPLPPPPPPPPQPPPPTQPKMVEQPPVLKPENKPKDEPKNPDKPPGPPSLPASGPPSDFGLGGPGGASSNGIGEGGGGSRWGWYADEVQTRIADALRQNDKTKDARIHLKVRIWVSGAGSITRVSLADSSGDPSLDEALKSQVLTGLSFPEAPPADMPMPIVMLINEQRPN